MAGKSKEAPKEAKPVEFEPSDHGVGPDDPTYQRLEVVSPDTRPDDPLDRRDAVNADIAADLAGKPRP